MESGEEEDGLERRGMLAANPEILRAKRAVASY